MRTVIPLGQGRLRRLEQRIDATERGLRDLAAQLDQATEVLTRLVRVVAVRAGSRVGRSSGSTNA